MLVRDEVEKAAPEILKAHGIAEDRSQDVRDRSTLPKQSLGILAGTVGQMPFPTEPAEAGSGKMSDQ